MTVEYLNPPTLMQSLAFSQAVVVSQPTRLVFVGGQNGVDKDGVVVGDLAAQTTRALENVGAAVAAAGGTIDDVVSWSIAMVSGQDIRAGYAAAQPFIAGRRHPPTITMIEVAGLGVPGALVEITAVAALP